MSDQGRALALETRRIDVQQGPAADRHDRRVRAHDEPVTRSRDKRRLEAKSREGRLAGCQLRPVEQERPRHDLAGADVEAHARTRLHRARRVRQKLERAVDQRRGDERAGQADHVAARDRGPLESLEVDRRALPRSRGGDGTPVRLQATDLGLGAPRIDLDAIVGREGTGGEGAGDDRSEPSDGEHAIDRKTR